jgi:hypothetical protein
VWGRQVHACKACSHAGGGGGCSHAVCVCVCVCEGCTQRAPFAGSQAAAAGCWQRSCSAAPAAHAPVVRVTRWMVAGSLTSTTSTLSSWNSTSWPYCATQAATVHAFLGPSSAGTCPAGTRTRVDSKPCWVCFAHHCSTSTRCDAQPTEHLWAGCWAAGDQGWGWTAAAFWLVRSCAAAPPAWRLRNSTQCRRVRVRVRVRHAWQLNTVCFDVLILNEMEK